MTDLREAMRTNAYPGRLVLLARTHDRELVGGYALTGRSIASRSRRIEAGPADLLTVTPTDDACPDALRHYTCALGNGRWTVFGNGEHVGQVFARLASQPPALALDGLDYEPDTPIHTPRITAVIDRSTSAAWLGAARRSSGRRTAAEIQVVAIRDLRPGDLVLLSTYQSDGHDVTTARVHRDLTTEANGREELLDELWSALDTRFRVTATTFHPLAGVTGPIRHHTELPAATPRSRA